MQLLACCGTPCCNLFLSLVIRSASRELVSETLKFLNDDYIALSEAEKRMAKEEY